MFKFNCELVFTAKVPFQFARAHVHGSPHHLVSFTVEMHSWNLIIVPFFCIARSKFPEIRGLSVCTCVARAPYTIIPQALHHRIALVERYQCIKFRVASSKFPESKRAYACAKCTCIARALCTPSQNDMHHRIMLIDLHQCTKFGDDSLKFP